MSRLYIRERDQSKLSRVKRKQLELQLLRAFDDQYQRNQSIQSKNSQLPKGIASKNSLKQQSSFKQKLQRQNYSVSSRKNLSKQSKKSTSRKLLLLKAIQEPEKYKFRYENLLYVRQQPTNRSNNSKTSMSSVKLVHLNKRKRIMTEFYEQKETQKLVKRLLNVKPSQQLTKRAQLNSYQKHVMVKNIMMHRVSDQPIKKDSIPLKNRQSRVNTIDLKQKDLRKFLKEEKKKTRQQSILEKLSKNQGSSMIYKRHRLNTVQPQKSSKKQLYSKYSAINISQPSTLPKIKIFTRSQSMPIQKGFIFKNQYKTPMQSRNKNYF